MALPNFSISTMDLCFLAEVDRLLQAGSFGTYRELAEQLDIHPTTFAQIESGRYHCNVKLLYLLKSFHPEADVVWVLLGQAETGRPEPTAPPKRERGRPTRVHKNAAHKYQLIPQNIKLELFRAKERTYYVDDFEHMGWKPFALDKISIHEVPGDHNYMFAPPHDEETGRILQAALNKIK